MFGGSCKQVLNVTRQKCRDMKSSKGEISNCKMSFKAFDVKLDAYFLLASCWHQIKAKRKGLHTLNSNLKGAYLPSPFLYASFICHFHAKNLSSKCLKAKIST